MKKITYLVIAAVTLISVASCVKDQFETFTTEGPMVENEFTVSLPPATRTSITEEGKTVWAAGDTLWVYNGVYTEKVGVPEEAWGKKEFKFVVKTATFSDTTKTLYVVYPYSAAAGVAEGKVKVKVPAVQNGDFGEANIAAAVAEDYTIALKNVTSLLKVTIPEETDAPIYSLSVSAANGNPLTGTCAVDFSGETPVVTPVSSGSNVSVQVDAFTGAIYLTVIPGTYDAGFKMTAATIDFEHASQTKVTTVANTVKVNDLVDLGVIGDDLKPLNGEGTEANPWQIETLGHMIALATTVSNGETFSGKFFKLVADIEGVNTPIGFYPNDKNNHPFCGDFDGANHTVKIDINGADQPYALRLGLFGALSGGAHIHDLVIDGSVISTGDALGALAGRVDAASDAPVLIENVTNKATVKGPNYIGGLVGYVKSTVADKFNVKNCVNEGTVTATGLYGGGIIGSTFDSQQKNKNVENCVNKGTVSANANAGGILGNGYYTTVKNCSNVGKVSAASPYNGIWSYVNKKWQFTGYYDRATGGIAGFLQNCAVNGCTNSGEVKGVLHVGGVVGSAYWTNIRNCSNSASVKSHTNAKYNIQNLTDISMVGGVVGYIFHHSSVYDSDNTGDISGFGMVGGVVGHVQGCAQTYGSASDRQFVKNCKNSGKISGTAKGVGGVCGTVTAQQFWPTVYVEDCVNDGEVVSTSEAVGGVVGMMYNFNTSNDLHVFGCVNNGDVKGIMWVGGIIGMGFSRANVTAAQWTAGFRNLENNGKVTATRAGASNALVTGGIIGTLTTNNYSTGTINMENVVNNGEVVYTDAGHVNTYVGGIAGRIHAGKIVNSASNAKVGPATGAKAEGADARMGAIVGSYEGGTVSNGYYHNAVCSQALGTAGKQVESTANVIVYDPDFYGFLEYSAKIKDEEYNIVDEALNAWIGTSTAYKTWVLNAQCHPVFDTAE